MNIEISCQLRKRCNWISSAPLYIQSCMGHCTMVSSHWNYFYALLAICLSIYLRVYSLHHNVLPTLQSIPLMINEPLYSITQDISQTIFSNAFWWAQLEWWLEHRHGWLVKRQWAGSILGWVSRDEYQVLGSTSIPARLYTLVYWEPFSWLTSVGTTRNIVIRLGWSRIGLAVLILHAAGVGLTDRPAVICGRYSKYHSLVWGIPHRIH